MGKDFLNSLNEFQEKEEQEWLEIKSKYGEYSGICPHCKRNRLMIGKDGKNRCEKCHWCVEDNTYDLKM